MNWININDEDRQQVNIPVTLELSADPKAILRTPEQEDRLVRGARELCQVLSFFGSIC